VMKFVDDGEVDDNVLNYYSPKDFSYDYKSQELK